MSGEQKIDLGMWRMCQNQNLQAYKVLIPSLKGAALGIVAAVVLVVLATCHLDQIVTQGIADQSAHVWQTSVYSCHSPGIAIHVVYNSYMLE